MVEQSQQALEFDGVVALLRRYISSPLGGARLDELRAQPRLTSAVAAAHELAEVGEAMDWVRNAARPDGRSVSQPPKFRGIEDIRVAVDQLSTENTTLEAGEIRDVLNALDRAEEIRRILHIERVRLPLMGAYGERLAEFKPLLQELAGKILPSGQIANSASSELSKIRRSIESQRHNVATSLERFVRKNVDAGALQADYVTVRNGRSVVPVKASWQGRVDGVVHGGSTSGQTVYVEPLDTIKQNNQLVRLLEDEQREIFRILREMTDRLREDEPAITEAAIVLADLEYVFARARFGQEFRCCLPTFCDDAEPRLVFEWARHPLLQDLLAKQGERPVPMSLRLEGGTRALLISGPNAGGKSVVLKTVGLLAMMAQAGVPVPADEARLPWFEDILADIGDSQSIAESLSTFSAHVSKLKLMIDHASSRSLVLLDELGSATDPDEGGALGVAVVERLLGRGAFVAISTHLPALKVFGSNSEHVVSAAMGFDEESLAPTYRLLIGVPGQSAGLAMARRFGMPDEVIERAREVQGKSSEDASKFLSELHRRVDEYAEDERKLRSRELALIAREEKLERDARSKAKLAKEQAQRRIEELTQGFERRYREALKEALDNIQAGAKSTRAAERSVAKSRGALRREMEQVVRTEIGEDGTVSGGLADELIVGNRVRVGSMGASGTITRKLAGERWEVQVGQLKMQVSTDDISFVETGPEPVSKLPAGVTYEPATRSSVLPSEINVIGKTADEARDVVDKYLDEAVLAEMPRVRIIHGFGQNILRRELSKMFRGHVHVAKHYDAELHEGGSGATIVEICT